MWNKVVVNKCCFFFELLTIHCMYNLDATLLSFSWNFFFLTFMQRMPNTVIFWMKFYLLKKYFVWVENTYFKERKMTFVQQKYKSTFNNRSLRRWLLLLLLLLTTNAHMIFWRKQNYYSICRHHTEWYKKGEIE